MTTIRSTCAFWDSNHQIWGRNLPSIRSRAHIGTAARGIGHHFWVSSGDLYRAHGVVILCQAQVTFAGVPEIAVADQHF